MRKILVLWTRKKGLRILFIWIFPLLIFLIIFSSSYFKNYEYKLSSGTQGGFYELIGKEFCEIINTHSNGKITLSNDNKTAGSVENLQKIADKTSSFGLAQDGLPADSKIRSILFLFESPLHIVVDSSLAENDISMLMNKRIYIGKRKSGTEFIAKNVFHHYGMDSSDYIRVGANWSFKEAAEQIIAKKIDAAFFLVASNSDAIELIAAKGNLI